MDEVGVPVGVFNLVQCFDEPVGSRMAEYNDVSTVLFIGSAEVVRFYNSGLPKITSLDP